MDAGGFTAAGQRLHRTQSAVSMQIRRLEDAFGKRVLRRDTRSLVPTTDGEQVLGYARRLLALHDEMLQAVSDEAASGWVRFGIPDDYAGAFLPRLLSGFAALHPRVQVDVRCALSTTLERQLAAGD